MKFAAQGEANEHPLRLMYRLPDAGKILSIPPETLRSLIRRGRLRVVREGRSIFLTRSELENYVARLEAEAGAADSEGTA